MIWVNTSLQGDAGGHTGTAPTHLHHIFPRIPHKQNNHLCTIFPNEINHPRTIHPNDINRPTRNPPLPISTKSRGVPLPHRGYTFDNAGLASAMQPTLGNDASENTTPLGVVLFLIAHHYHTRRMDYS